MEVDVFPNICKKMEFIDAFDENELEQWWREKWCDNRTE